jgi:hypothetical protein
VAGTPLILEYVISNPLPGPRAIEWTLSSERDWPGFPNRGVEVVAGGGSQAVRIERTLPEGSLDAPNELTFAAGFSGAPGYVAIVRHLVRTRPDPPRELAVHVLGPAAGARARVEFTLRDASPARLELLDVAGRRLFTRPVGSLGPGIHALDLSEGAEIKSGIYFVRLLQAEQTLLGRGEAVKCHASSWLPACATFERCPTSTPLAPRLRPPTTPPPTSTTTRRTRSGRASASARSSASD